MPSVLKFYDILVDENNTVQIKTDIPALAVLESEVEIVEEGGDEEETAEEIARQIVAAAEQQARTMHGEATLALADARREAEHIKTIAEQQAATLLEEMRVQGEKDAAAALEVARDEGYQKGLDEAQKVGDKIKADAEAVLVAAKKERDEIHLAIEPDAVQLIIDILEKLMGDIVNVHPNVIISLLKLGFAESTQLYQSEKITIRVSEEDFPQVSLEQDELIALAGGKAELEIISDKGLSRSDCIIETPFGGIDVSLTPQFEAIKENLIYLVKHR
ncbi:MAG: FliH/SctL family protein [Turicibacter sp.]|nr:FliH/SctL family protein [Turicibacter sp.]